MNKWIGRAAMIAMIGLLAACSDDPMGGVAVDRVDVGPENPTLLVGESTELTATPKTSGGDVVTGVVYWRSLNPAVATVRASGGKAVIEAKSAGVARVEAESGGRTGHTFVTVAAAAAQVAVVELQPASLVVGVGESVPLEAIAKTAGGQVIAGRAATWSVWPGGIAAVTPNATGGVTVTAHTEGEAVIRATIDGVIGQAELRVVTSPPPAPEILYLHFTLPRRGIWTNQMTDLKHQLVAVGRNGTVPDPAVTWSVEDATIAAVDGNGVVRGIRAGTTRVHATAGTRSAVLTITVFQPVAPPTTWDLTYDWWDGQWRMSAQVGTETWTDAQGTDHDVTLWLTGGSLTLREDDRYERRLEVKGWAHVDGAHVLVIEREIVDEGKVWIIVGGEAGYTMQSSTTPGYEWKLVGWREAGHLVMQAAIGTAPSADYLLRMRQ